MNKQQNSDMMNGVKRQRRYGRIGLVLTAMLLAAAIALLPTALGARAETVITVIGTGETPVSADSAVITLGVNVHDKEVLKAQQAVNERIAAVREAVLALGVPEEYVNTDYLNLYAVYDYVNGQEQVQAYSAGSSLSIRVPDIDTAGRVIDAAFAAGANTLEGITFTATDTGEARTQSITKAVADARAKAETLAVAAGLRITGITAMEEDSVYSYSNTYGNYVMDRAESAKASETVVQAAKVIVSAGVRVTFTAE